MDLQLSNSMHSTIERKISGPMYCPRDYVVAIQNALKNPSGYTTIQLEYSDFMGEFQNAYLTSIRPVKRAGDPVVNKIRVFKS